MGSGKKIVRGVFWTYVLNFVNAIYGFIAVPILIGYFGKSEYGLIGLAMSINVYMRLMDMGFNSTNVRFFSTWLSESRHDKVKKAFQTSLAFYGFIGLLNGLILLVLSFFSDSIFNVTSEQDSILKTLLYILALSAFCHWFSSCFDQLIKATENVAWIQRRQLIPKFLQIIVLFATVYMGFSIEWYYLLTCLATLSIIPISVTKIWKVTPYVSFLPKIDKQLFMEMLPYSLNIFSFSLFQFSFYHLRPVFLGMQGTMESVTDFRVLNGIIGLVHTLGGAFIPILLPSTARVMAQKNISAYYKVAYDGTKYISILLCYLTFAMMAVGKDVITLYVGDSYLVLIPWFYMWLVLNCIGTHNQAISSLILAGTDIRAISYNSAIASVLGLLSSWFLIPDFQIGGVILGFLVYEIVQLCFYYMYYWPKRMKINSFRVLYYSFGPYCILGILTFFACSYIPRFENNWYNLVVVGIVFTAMYFVGTVLMANKTDKEFLINTIISKRKNV